MLKDKLIKASVFILYAILIIAISILFKNEFSKFSATPVIIKSKEDTYSSNEVIVEYDENKIQKLSVAIDDNIIELKNKQNITLSETLDGKKYRLIMTVEYKDGKKENIEQEYEVYNECGNNINTKKETTECSSSCGTGVKYLITKSIDKKTGKLCNEKRQEITCTEKNCRPNNSGPTDTTNKSKNDEEYNIDNSKDETNNNTDEISNDTTIPKKYNCSLTVSKGTKGANGWYISDVTIKLNKDSSVSKYGISTSTSATYNTKTSLKITEETSKKTYYGYVKYKDGKTAKCSIVLKIDKTTPTTPTSIIRKNSSSGEIIKNSKNYKNYKIWWGDFKATDKTSKIDHFEYSTKCTGSKSGNLKNSYLYPLSNASSYNSYYCIRSVDKAGNVSGWSTANYFYVDLVKPTCLISRYGNTIKINGSDANSGVNAYSIDNGAYGKTDTKVITSGSKTLASVKDNAGNIGTCEYIDRIKTMILIGDSRTYHIQRRYSANNIIKPDVYEVESGKVYFVARSGGYYKWFTDGMTNNCDKGEICKTPAIEQVNQLLDKLNKEKKYRDIVILSNLGVNDVNRYDATTSANNYIKKYGELMKNNWKSTEYLKTSFAYISTNPIDEKLIKCISSNKRTNAKVETFNLVMKKAYGSNYFDSNSQLKKSSFGTGYDIRANCPNGDGLHYNASTDKKIYELYKSFVF